MFDAGGGRGALTQAVPANAANWFRLGNSYARLDEPALAITAYRAALQRDPHIVPAWHNLGAVLLEEAQAAYGQAAASAQPEDPLRQASALLAARIGAVRDGASSTLPRSTGVPAAAASSIAPPPTTAGLPDEDGGSTPPAPAVADLPEATAAPSRAGGRGGSSPVRTSPLAHAASPGGASADPPSGGVP